MLVYKKVWLLAIPSLLLFLFGTALTLGDPVHSVRVTRKLDYSKPAQLATATHTPSPQGQIPTLEPPKPARTPAAPIHARQNNTGMMIGAIVLLAIILVGIFFSSRKSKSTS
jgi:hypothetical protein